MKNFNRAQKMVQYFKQHSFSACCSTCHHSLALYSFWDSTLVVVASLYFPLVCLSTYVSLC